ncbi:MAG: hypothetical protein OEN01_08580 [Candidatus Krumholzibacteria bacterium]|nr:hypothetical protein [Candidatus Krumholzibacteria bacterium]
MTLAESRQSGTVVCLIVLLLFVFASSCSDDPTGTVDDSVDLSGQGEIDPNGERDFFIGATSVDGTAEGRIDVWAHNLQLEADNVVSFDVVLINRSRQVIFPPVLFLITRLIPSEVAVLNPDLITIVGPGGFDFSDDLGDDNRLDPGEQTAPVHMRFGLPGPTSFAIGFRIEVGSPPSEDVIAGVVFHDANRNGERENDEPGLAGVPVQVTGTLEGEDPVELIGRTITDEQGRYGFARLRPDIYEVTALAPPGWAETTPNPLIVTLLGDSSGVHPITGVDFGFFVAEPPPPPPPPPIEAVFGPQPVGPSSSVGTVFEGSFPIRSNDTAEPYVLSIVPPAITGSLLLMRIDLARVWINQEPVFDFECTPDTLCVPYEHVEIPPELIVVGENSIEITVEGDEHAVLLFTIFRKYDWTD